MIANKGETWARAMKPSFGSPSWIEVPDTGMEQEGGRNTHRFPASGQTACSSVPQANRPLQERLRLLDSKVMHELHQSRRRSPDQGLQRSVCFRAKQMQEAVEKYMRQLPRRWCRQMLKKQESLLLTGGPAGAGAHDGWGRKPTPQRRHLPRKCREQHVCSECL